MKQAKTLGLAADTLIISGQILSFYTDLATYRQNIPNLSAFYNLIINILCTFLTKKLYRDENMSPLEAAKGLDKDTASEPYRKRS